MMRTLAEHRAAVNAHPVVVVASLTAVAVVVAVEILLAFVR